MSVRRINNTKEGEDGDKGFRWEQTSSSINGIQEDDEGNIIATTTDRNRSLRAKKQRITQSVRRGLIRYLVVAVDSSDSSGEVDFRPCRLEAVKINLKKFISEYFDQNPISQLSLTITRDRGSERISELSGNPKNHLHKLEGIKLVEKGGFASLQKTISLALGILKHIPDYGHRELLIIYNSLSTTDPAAPNDIFTTLEECKKYKIRISIICVVAEIYICKKIAEVTGGSFSVATDVGHFSELLLAHTIPPPDLKSREPQFTDFVYMGFPKRTFDSTATFGYDGNAVKIFSSSYICPRCHTRTSEIPTQCNVCSVQLNSSSHIARSHHHLFPVSNFNELSLSLNSNNNLIGKKINNFNSLEYFEDDNDEDNSIIKFNVPSSGIVDLKNDNNNNNNNNNSSSKNNNKESKMNIVVKGIDRINDESTYLIDSCKGCLEKFTYDSTPFQCPHCLNIFCVECDLFIHDSLHNCPGC